MYLRPFDPWKNELCSCPPKYSLNPYTGCEHGCLYCYASSYIKDFFNCRLKLNLIEKLKKEIEKVPTNSLISLSNTSDPYPPKEKFLRITRKCLEIFKKHEIRILVITKSNIVCRDIDILKEMPSSVTITVTTLRYDKVLEPFAPSSLVRLKALESLSKRGIPTGLRLDPLIPLLNEREAEKILRLAKSAGVSHVTASTFKPRWDSWRRIENSFSHIAKKIRPLYFEEGIKKFNAWYLSETRRKELISELREICDSLSLSFSSCREGFLELNSAPSCDGSHLCIR